MLIADDGRGVLLRFNSGYLVLIVRFSGLNSCYWSCVGGDISILDPATARLVQSPRTWPLYPPLLPITNVIPLQN